MGQVQSDVAPEPVESRVDDSGERISSPSPSPSSSSASPPSMESLISEAAAFGEEGGDSLEDKAQKALDCPCIAHLRSGSCGDQFSEAFLCFLKSTAEEKGSDCVNPFVALQDCIKAHPDAFSKDVLEEENEEKENEVLNKDYKIHPPNFAKERRTPKPKL